MALPPIAPIKLEMKLSEETTDNLVNAALDLISPIRHGLGLVGDRLQFYRLYQKEVLAKIYQLSESRIRKINQRVDLKPKFAIPYIEKASAEDIESELVNWWSNLLVSAFSNKDSQRPIFVDFVSKLTSDDALLLENFWRVCGGVGSATQNHFIYVSEFVRTKQLAVAEGTDLTADLYETSIREICRALFEDSPMQGILLSGGRFLTNGERSGIPTHVGNPWNKAAIETCLILGILKRETVGFDILGPYMAPHYFDCEVICFTEVGAAFMKACHA